MIFDAVRRFAKKSGNLVFCTSLRRKTEYPFFGFGKRYLFLWYPDVFFQRVFVKRFGVFLLQNYMTEFVF